MRKTIAISCLLLLPNVVFANVLVSEIAWMGDSVSGSNEWIELRNDSDIAADISGWSLSSEDGSPAISLDGVIFAGGYFLIERTDDDAVSGIPADLIASFGNGLSNTGEFLRLRNASGIVVDSVNGAGSWSTIGGDNDTKDTAQRDANGNWYTAPGTPRSPNAAGVLSAGEDVGTNFTVDIGEDRKVFVKTSNRFSGKVSGVSGEDTSNVSYVWNFGDGSSADVQTADHAYAFPGEYVVTLEARYSGRVAIDRLTVRVVEPKVSVTGFVPGTGGYIELKNLSSEQTDLSGWSVATEGVSFIFPANTAVLAEKSIRIPNSISGLSPSGGSITLSLPGGAIVDNRDVSDISASLGGREAAPQKKTATASDSEDIASRVASGSPTVSLHASGEEAAGAEQSASVLWSREDPIRPLGPSTKEWILLTSGLLLLGSAGFILYRSHASEPTEAEEYSIIEDIIEGVEDGDGKR